LLIPLVSARVSGQETPRDTVPGPPSERGAIGVRFRLGSDTLVLPRPASLLPFGRFARQRSSSDALADAWSATLERALQAQRQALWGQTTGAAFRDATRLADTAAAPPVDIARQPPPDTTRDRDILGDVADLGLQFQSRIELKTERTEDERCIGAEVLSQVGGCSASFQPQFDFEFGVRSGGIVADRVHVDVDYDSQREFDASNNISVYYEGRPNEVLQRVEVGNVTFAPPPSRFITGGIPSGNYGFQAIGKLGSMNFRTIYAQQKGNVVKDRIFTVGDRTLQTVNREIEDYQVERRRFFWVVDPRQTFPSRFPNIDILDPGLSALALQIPPGQRPRRVVVYRYRPPTPAGSAARDINGPFAVSRFARNTNEIGPYEVLQQGIDYYLDPTNLWIALVTPIGRGERLAVSYTVTGPDGREAVVSSVGGTLPTQRNPAGTDTVNLLWDDEVLPGDAAFNREIRAVYRLGGGDLLRTTLSLKIVVGSGSDQEKPVGGTADTYLELFGLTQRNNPSAFDVENRLWPRVGDPILAVNASGVGARLIRDNFLVFPSLQPFADSGLVDPPNPVNDSLYRVADEDLASQRRPPTQYRIRASYSAEGDGEAGSLALGSVQLRANSERISVDGIPLQREVDYRIDYELGRVTWVRPDTLFPRARQVAVQFEENPLFALASTSIFGFTTQLPLENGQLNFTAISQSQQSSFNRPPLGFEPVSTIIAGVNGNFTVDSPALTRALDALPMVRTSAPSSVTVQGEFATSRPQGRSEEAAYVESFEGEGGFTISLQESAWRLGSQPAINGTGLPLAAGAYDAPLDLATTLVWQNLPTVTDQATGIPRVVQISTERIDSQFVFIGAQSFRVPETVLWTVLFPTSVGGFREADGGFQWSLPHRSGRRWRSISQPLNPTGVDLTRVEQLEFWALIDTSGINRPKNPTLVFDFGDVSENSVSFAPESLTVRTVAVQTPQGAAIVVDSAFTGRVLTGFDALDSERDSITRSFDAAINDTGIPGERVERLVLRNEDDGSTQLLTDVRLCTRGITSVLPLADPRNNCTAGNRRLNEEDLDLDGVLNLSSANRNGERLVRFVVDMSDRSSYTRVGLCYRSVTDTIPRSGLEGRVCWVQFRLPFSAPTELVGEPLVRRVKSLRLTVVSGTGDAPNEFRTVPIARLKLSGSPWIKRAEQPLTGVAGDGTAAGGFVVAAVIGTQDRDPASGLLYESPPGVTDEADNKQTSFAAGQVQVNERSLRLLAGNMPVFHRAEAYYRFPEGEKNLMGYEELRVWARGRNKGWGPQGDLQFYIKLGRDVDNFYLYRTQVNSGGTREAWLPEIRVDFRRFFALRAQIQNAFLRGGDTLACSGLDSALVVNSAPAPAPGSRRFAACDGGYIVYSSNPGITPPNLAAVQEMAVGIVRTSSAGLSVGGPITPTDTLELWVDDVRLTNLVRDAGYAGQFGVSVVAGDVATLQVNVSRRDGNFRQLSELPTFITDNQLNLASAVQLDKFLPSSLGILLPLSVNHARFGSDPFFLSKSDISAAGVDGIRTPSSSATSLSLSARRATPLQRELIGPIVNNLALQATYAGARSEHEFQTGRSSSFTSSLDYNVTSRGRSTPIPGFIRGALGKLPGWLRETDFVRAVRGSSIRWTPTQVRFTTGYARNVDRRTSFTLPIATPEDTGRRVDGLTSVWRNMGVVELRPFNSLTARWNLTSWRDMRDYGDSTTIARAAEAERERLLGMDVGLERERQMSTVISATPVVTSWLRPRLEFSGTYSMLRDPNARGLIADGSGELHIPRRVSNNQGLGATTVLDLGRLMTIYSGDSSLWREVARVVQPVEVIWRRDLRSTYDGVPFSPDLGYQLALGDERAFRQLDGTLATSAAVSNILAVSHTLAFPLGLTIVDRYSRSTTTSWARALDAQATISAEQTTFPDVSVRWSYAPLWLGAIISSVGGQLGARVTKARSLQPLTSALGGGLTPAIRFEQETRQFPINGSITWALFGGFSTSAGWNRVMREEVRSGGLTESEQTDLSGDIAKAFKLPEQWGWRGNTLRARVGYQQSTNRSFFVLSGLRKRIADNGRWAVNANADSDISETMSFSLTLSRIINFDRNYDRRVSQTVFSVVLHLNFFAGDLR
jgi:hypothetical protein